MADLDNLRNDAKQKFGIMQRNTQRLLRGALNKAQRISAREELIGNFDDLKKILTELNKIESKAED